MAQIPGIAQMNSTSYLGTAAVAGLSYAQTIYFLPISLFGMSVAAAELPQMSGTELLEKIRGYDSDIAVIVATARDDAAFVELVWLMPTVWSR